MTSFCICRATGITLGWIYLVVRSNLPGSMAEEIAPAARCRARSVGRNIVE